MILFTFEVLRGVLQGFYKVLKKRVWEIFNKIDFPKSMPKEMPSVRCFCNSIVAKSSGFWPQQISKRTIRFI